MKTNKIKSAVTSPSRIRGGLRTKTRVKAGKFGDVTF